MSRSVAQKMGIKEGARAFFVNAPDAILEAMELPQLEISDSLSGDLDYIHLFSITRAEMDEGFPKLKLYLKPSGMLWLFTHPKKGKVYNNSYGQFPSP